MGLPCSGTCSWDPRYSYLYSSLTHLSGYIRREYPLPGVQDRKAAHNVSSRIPNLVSGKKYFRVCWRQGRRGRNSGTALCAGLGEGWSLWGALTSCPAGRLSCSGLADDEVGPLHDHDASKKGRVISKLQHLPLLKGLRGGQAVSEGIQIHLKSYFPFLPSWTPRAELGIQMPTGLHSHLHLSTFHVLL